MIADKNESDQLVFGEVLAAALGVVGNNKSVNMITTPPIRSNSANHTHLMELLAL